MRELIFDPVELRLFRDIVPFVWIGPMVIQFFTTIRVSNVSPAIGPQGVVAFPM